MADEVLNLKISRQDIIKALSEVPEDITGHNVLSDEMLLRVGKVLLKLIRQSFIIKSKGGTDTTGIRWAPLQPSTIKRKKKTTRRARSDILNDTGELLKSLTPDSNNKYQILRISRGKLVIGTSREGAAKHHKGDLAKRIPQRKLWPDPQNWPDSWWEEILTEVQKGVVDTIVQKLKTANIGVISHG